MLIFASISFLLPPTLTIQPSGLLMQINDNLTYHLMGMRLICQYFYKSWKMLTFPFC
ncbi:TPA: hypothetical protein MD281_003680 [Klebsiella pneumoniae]|nr:hypothetical protein [Klebsiella pneumoniae]HBT3736600.1 hypothetical protein [Klebsiella pneumoniae]HBT4767133.1 hypothetical protein [Klebsiella pneumoniae]HBT4995526.1 hypothetical protein [Klebsiella pneumoniae]HBT5016067.1 hypothetical protein [Klebsiella pneumoniae]